MEKKFLWIENSEEKIDENLHNIEKIPTPTPISMNSFSIFIKCNFCKINEKDFLKNEICLKCVLKILMNYPKTINIIFEKDNEFYKFNRKTLKNLKNFLYDI